MALKIAINGEKKSIAGRTSRPVVFIDGVKKRITKGLTFVNGEKKYLWGTENKIDFFVVPEILTSGSYVPPPVYIDDKRLVVGGNIIDVSNIDSPQILNSYSWGYEFRRKYEDGKTVYYGVQTSGNNFIINEIVYNSGANTALVRMAFTFSKKSSAALQDLVGARLDNGVWLSIYSFLVATTPTYTYSYGLYKDNTKVADIGNADVSLVENHGNGIWGIQNRGLYNITESGMGSVVYSPEYNLLSVCSDGDGLLTSETRHIKKLDSQYGVVWEANLYDDGDNPIAAYPAKFIGKGKDGHCYALVYSDVVSNRPTNITIKEFDGETGELIMAYPFNHYDDNGKLILDWGVGGYISNSGYLAVLGRSRTSSNLDMYVARIFAG